MAASKKKDEAKPESTGFFLFRGGFWAHTFFRLLIGALVAAGGWLALAMARDKAVDLRDFQVSPASLEFISKPDWVTGPIERQLKNFGWAGEKISLLDTDAAKMVAAALLANPMVRKVTSVKREFPDRVRAKVELREPVALVLRGNRYYMVDAEGTRLPGEFRSRSAVDLDLMLVAYVRSTPPPAGKIWDDPAVVEASRLAGFLKDHGDLVKKARITAIDSSNVGGRRSPREPEITLLTADHTKIFWGRSVYTHNVTELPGADKIANLKKVIEETGRLADKEYVDLRFANPVYRNRSYYIGGY